MNLGTLRIDELVMPIDEIHLRNGRVEIRALVEVTVDNLATLDAIQPDAMVMVYGDDGSLIVTGRPGGWAVPASRRVGDTIGVGYQLEVDDKMTTEMRQRRTGVTG